MAHITFLQIFKYLNALGNVASKQNVGVIVTDQRSSRAPKLFCIFSYLKLVSFQKPRQGKVFCKILDFILAIPRHY